MSDTVHALDIDQTRAAYFAPATMSTHGNTMYVSGQGGVAANGTVPSDYESQIYMALVALRKILVAASSSVSGVLKLTLYIVNYDAKSRKHVRPLQKFLGSHRPAITLVPVPRLAVDSWLFEVDAVVALPAPLRLGPRVSYSSATLATTPTVDVAIIGAGLAGLTAAEKVLAAGFSCIVLEARDRVGGRTWSQRFPGGSGSVDLGAAWLNRTNQSRTYGLAKRFGAELIEQNTTGKVVLEDQSGKIVHFAYGDLPEAAGTTTSHLAAIRDMVERDCQQIDPRFPRDAYLDSVTFAEYLRARKADAIALATATVWTRAMLGQEPEDVSALFFLHYCRSGGGLLQMRSDREHGGQFLRVRQGTQHLALGLAEALPAGTVRLSSATKSVHRVDTSRTEVAGDGFQIVARKVIVAVPPPALTQISFTPALPAAKTLLASAYNYGYYRKAMVSFRTPFWVEKGFCGLVQSFNGPISIIRDTSVPADDKHVLTCFMAGRPGYAWSLLGPAQRTEALLAQIGLVFDEPSRARDEFLEVVDYAWNEDGFAGYGCPSPSLPPGVLGSAVDAIRSPVGDVHFIGTETAEEWKGYMEGAIASGERGAMEVVDALNRTPAKI